MAQMVPIDLSTVSRATLNRFWLRVRKNGKGRPCWVWTGATDRSGHGRLRVGGRDVFAHVFSYALENGTSPPNRVVHHRCEVPGCVNPAHLVALTPGEHRTAHSVVWSGRDQ